MPAPKPRLAGHVKLALSVGFAFVPVATLIAINSSPEVRQSYRDLKEKAFRGILGIGEVVQGGVETASAKHEAKQSAAAAAAAASRKSTTEVKGAAEKIETASPSYVKSKAQAL